jgi:hypothetical protein
MSHQALTPSLGFDAEHQRTTWALLLSVIAMTVPAAYFSGTVMLRWGDPVDLPRHLAVLHRLPETLGEWRFVTDGKPISVEVQNELQLRGYAHRVYEHDATGQRVAILLLIGPAGPLVRHPPEICYETGANILLGSQSLTIDSQGQPDRLRLLEYRPESPAAGDFLVAYGFADNQHWDSPVSPRLAYGGKPLLYKLQVLTEASAKSTTTNSAGLTDFLSQLLPTLRTAMLGNAGA